MNTQRQTAWGLTPGCQKTLWWLGALLLAAIAYRTMEAGFYRLLWDPTRSGAIDLKIFHGFVSDWFAGRPVYETNRYATYPPASYALLWLAYGWLPVPVLRWCFAGALVVALVGWIWILLRAAGAGTRWERVWIVLIVLAMNTAGVCIGNGQLIFLILPPLLGAVFLVERRQKGWLADFLVAGLFLLALVKPTVSAPFFWLVLFRSRRWRPAALTVAGYLLITWFASSFQAPDLVTQLRGWLSRGTAGAAAGGYGNIQFSLAAMGLDAWMVPVSVGLLLALGGWVYRYRDRDLWLLLGVIAIFARLWSYHRVYDDVLILLPVVALYRIVKQHGSVPAAVLCGVLVASLVAPGPWHDIAPPWRHWYDALHVVAWLAALGFLLWWEQRMHEPESARPN